MRAFLAALLLLFAALLGALEVLTLLDPVGAKMADDGDPLGDPGRSRVSHAVSAVLVLMPLAGAVLLLRGRKRA